MDASLRASFCILAFAIVAQAQAPFPQLEQTPRRWIFELKNAPVAQGGSRRAVQDDQRAFRQAVRNAGVNFRERLAFEKPVQWNIDGTRSSRRQHAFQVIHR